MRARWARMAVVATVVATGMALVGGPPASAAVGCALVGQVTEAPGTLGLGLARMSADGSHLVFLSEADLVGDNEDGSYEAYRTDLATGEIVQITDVLEDGPASGVYFNSHPAISADGSVVALPLDVPGTPNDFLFEVYTWTEEDGLVQRSSDDDQSFTDHIDIDDEGDTLVWSAARDLTGGNPDGGSEVFLLELDEVPEVQQLTSSTASSGASTISGDGSTVAFESRQNVAGANPDGRSEVWVQTLGEDPVQVTEGPDPSSQPTLDHTGETLAYIFDPLPSPGGDFDDSHLVRQEAGESPELVVPLLDRLGNLEVSSQPEISADGNRIVFQSDRLYDSTSVNPSRGYAWLYDHGTGGLTNVAGPDPSLGPESVSISGDGTLVAWVALIDRVGGYPDSEAFLSLCLEPTFRDVSAAHPFFVEVEALAGSGIIAGYSDGTFRPAALVSRQAAAAFFYRLAGEPPFSAPNPPTFDDVGAAHPFRTEIEWLADEGITGGYPDGGFHPGAPVTRQSMAAFFYRFDGVADFEPPTPPTFDDVSSGHPFVLEIEWLADQGITGGYPDGGFHPSAAVTRQAMAAFLHRFGIPTD